MNGTALYRALVEAGASEERAKEAAKSVVHAPEGATKADIAGVKTEIAEMETRVNANIAGVNANVAEFKVDMTTALAELRTELAAVETRIERSLREMSVRFLTLLIASQAVLFAGLRLTGG